MSSETHETQIEENTLSSTDSYSFTNSLCLGPKSNHDHILYDVCESSDEEIEADVNPDFEPIGSWGLYGIYNKAWCDKYRPVLKFISYDNLELTSLEKSGYLSDRIIASCSSYLEKCPANKKLVFCKCILSNKVLKNIEILQFHCFFQYLDLSFNYLEDVSVLQYLPFLMHLDVSSNNLKALLNFKAPYNLTYVNYSFNQIQEIPDLSDFWSIKYLYLQHNDILKISGLTNLRYLETLDLSYNKIKVIENLDTLNLFNLYLQHNHINSFVCNEEKGFKTMPYLSYIRLNNNELQSLKIFECAVLVQSIEIQNNEINNLLEISYLNKLQMLSSINLDRNPIRNQENYESVCLSMMKNLKFLDGLSVDTLQKVHAQVVLHPNINLQAVKFNDDLLSLSHLSQFTNIGLEVIPADQAPRPIIIIVGPICSKHEQLVRTFVEQYSDRVIKLKNHIDREIRIGETSDLFYYNTKEDFNQKLLNGEFIMLYNVFQNYCGLSQEEYAKGLKENHKVMITISDLKAALAFKMRGLRPTIVLAIPESEDIHREWIASEMFDFPLYNKSFPDAAIRVTPKESMISSSTFNKSTLEDTFLKFEKQDKDQISIDEDESAHFNAYEFLQSDAEDYFFGCSKFLFPLETLLHKAEETGNDQYYPINVSYFDEESSNKSSSNLKLKFEQTVLQLRKFYLNFHRSHPGTFYATVYTDCFKKAIKKLKNITKAAMSNHLLAQANDIDFGTPNHSITFGRLRLYDMDVEN